MEDMKPELLDTFFQQIESQVQFGDSKASLLVAGNSPGHPETILIRPPSRTQSFCVG